MPEWACGLALFGRNAVAGADDAVLVRVDRDLDAVAQAELGQDAARCSRALSGSADGTGQLLPGAVLEQEASRAEPG